MKLLYCDLETWSETPIKCGSFRYSENAEILLWGHAVDDDPAAVWDLTTGAPMPTALKAALDEVLAGERHVVWHNGVLFDTVMLERVMGIKIPLEMVIDTMIIAYQHGLTGALGDLCTIFRMPYDVSEGKDLVRLFCTPRPVSCRIRRETRSTSPEKWARFVNYCRLDVEAERALYKKLPKFNCTEWEKRNQLLDAEINRRGMRIDVDLARAAIAVDAAHKAELRDATSSATDGELESTTQRDAFMAYVERAYGWRLENCTKGQLEKRLGDPDVPEPVKDLLRLRLSATRTSTQKFQAIINATNSDGRLRGCLQFRGASRTGRFSGRLFQPQNLPRPKMSNAEIYFAIDAVKSGEFDAWYGDPSKVLPDLLRGEIIASKGNKLVVADFSNIVGRVLAWLSGEEWKIKAFREFDAGRGHDLYKLTYGRTFGVDPGKVTKPQRQMGKVLELALGYGGGAGAFATFARGFGIDLHGMAKTVQSVVDPSLWRAATDAWDWASQTRRTADLDKPVFIACDAVKRAWRKANAKIEGFWWAVDQAIASAMASPERAVVGRITFERRGSYLLVQLPSGRYLCYPSPRVGKVDSSDTRDCFSYYGVNQYTRKWERIRSYGPKACIAAGTPVLCRNGWTPIEDVTSSDEVWDGVEWVRQDGAIDKGIKQTMMAYGVRMTPDHKVLTTEGWCCASQSKGFGRADCRIPDGYGVCGLGRAPHAVEMPVCCLREDGCSELKAARPVQEGQEVSARHEPDADLVRMAFHEGALRDANCASMEELRWPRNHGLQRMERVVREVLRGHGTELQEGATARPNRQREGLLEGQLPMGHTSAKREQPEAHRVRGREAACHLGTRNRNRSDDPVLQVGSRLPEGALVRQARREEQVYDLVNCGPRNRFVVLGSEGPVIVHNCENIVQGVACDLLCEALLKLDAAGYKAVLHVHDEVIADVPDRPEFSVSQMEALMCSPPAWATGIPLAAAGFESYRYKKD